MDLNKDISSTPEGKYDIPGKDFVKEFNLGLDCYKNGNIQGAINCFTNSLRINENFIDANFNLAIIYRDEKNYSKALIHFLKSNQIESNNFTIIFNIAYCYEMQEEFELAVTYYKRAEKLSTSNAELYFNLGNIYKTLRKWDEAAKYYNKALNIESQNIECLLNYASVCYFTGKNDEAIDTYRKLLRLDKNNFNAKINYCAALVETGEFSEAVQIYDSLLKENNDDGELHYNAALLNLLLGKNERGFEEYEWRLQNKNKYNLYPEIDFWQNENLNGKRILVIDEQGVGDAIQFVRYLSLLKENGAEVIYSCRTELFDFMKEAKVADQVIPLASHASADYKIYLMSLPFKFSKTTFDIHSYLNFSSDFLKQNIIEFDKNKLNIGIVWKGNPEHYYDFKRSVKLNDLEELFSIEGTAFYSLQLDTTDDEKETLVNLKINDLSNKLNSFSTSAKVIDDLDLIISVDTATAHLAGALNKETFLLLSKIPDWRWGLDSETTSYYPTVKLFRQKYSGKWESVISGIHDEIINMLNLKWGKQRNELNLAELKVKGLEALEQKNYQNAIIYLEEYCKILPDDLDAQYWLAISHYEGEKIPKAEDILLKLAAENVRNEEVFTLLGKLYLRLEDFPKAVNYFEKVLNYNENFDTINGLGFAHQRLGEFDEAFKYFERAIILNNRNAQAYLNLANNYYYTQNYESAIKYFDEAIKLENLSSAHVGKSFAYLTQKIFNKGFYEYEWSLDNFELPAWSKAVKWTGQSGKGKNIFIYTEQGLGDSIQFLRFLNKVKEKGFNITLACPHVLKGLFKTSNLIDNFGDRVTPEMDYYSSIMNLPNALNLEKEEDFILSDELFHIEDNIAEKYEYYFDRNKLNVGVVWHTNSKFKSILNKSIEFDRIEKLLENENVNFYVLQNDCDLETINLLNEKYPRVKIIEEELHNLAAFIQKLDLVITIDTMVAHLSSSLNVETWVLLSFLPDWRWQDGGENSYWYKTAKLYRQTEFGNWDSIISKINSDLNLKSESLVNGRIDNKDKISHIKKLLDDKFIESAQKELIELLKIFPHDTEGNFYLGYAFHIQNDLENAAKYYALVLNSNPTHFDALNNLGVVLKDLGRFDESKEFLKYAAVIEDKNSSVYNNLGIVEDLLGNFETAVKYFQKALSLNPEYLDALLNLANTFQTLRDYSKSIQTLDNLLRLNSVHVGGNFNKSLTLLSMGNYKEGFQLYEWRRKRHDFYLRNFAKPELTTQNISGKKVLVYDEQGLGDTLQFCRYVQLLSENGAIVILQCHSALVELLKGCMGVDTVIARQSLNDPGIEYDYHIPLLSLPKLFASELKSVPRDIPYIEVQNDIVEKFKGKYFNSDKINVGIVWEGKTPVGNSHRACPFENFIPMTQNEDFKFFSLQKENKGLEKGMNFSKYNITDLSEELISFNETAAIIKNLDLVITIDTSVAHLAGALGAKTILLLSYKTDWRWLNGESESVWYPGMRLIRQNKFGNWNYVFEQINFLLKSMKWISKKNNNNNNKRSLQWVSK